MLVSIVLQPQLYPIGGGYQALSATPAVQLVNDSTSVGGLERIFSDSVVQFDFPDCGALQTFDYDCDANPAKNVSTRKSIVREVKPGVAVLGDTFNSACSRNEQYLREEYKRMKQRFEIQKWFPFSTMLATQLSAVGGATPVGSGPYSLPHAVAALVNQASGSGVGPIVIHGPPGWLQAGAPASLGTLNLRDPQVYFAASPGFTNTLGPNGGTMLFASSAVHVVFEETELSDTEEKVVVNNSKSVLFEARFAGAVGCAWSVETTWCI